METREVEDFGRRLNSVKPERIQDLLSSGQERRLVPVEIDVVALNYDARLWQHFHVECIEMFGYLEFELGPSCLLEI
ncbi:SKP1 21 [Olea europaea subsp. europaea]|uniref:SKP1 21 n=1 Tax=Olea europaea subsp. europaea TaxID=158383 RepID=A0A8S0V3C7_OLEEU|nr:SKP1 21 [Olea europaea subsp. europaea]